MLKSGARKRSSTLSLALALTDETRDRNAGVLIERALDELRAALWPALDASWDRVLRR